MQIESHSEPVAANWNFVSDFPELPSPFIDRRHVLRSISELLTHDAPVLFLEGEPQDGATCALAAFCKAKSERAFSLFIKPASKLSYSLDYLRIVLAEQLHWCLSGTALNKDRVTETEFNSLLIRVTRKFRDQPLYFIVDGLHQIPGEDKDIAREVFTGLLPIGIGNCRFVIAGPYQDLASYLHKSVKARYWQLPRFTIEECRVFLEGTEIGGQDCEKVYRLCREGSPGRLAAIRRLLLTGTSLTELLELDPGKYLDFVKIEFDALDSMSETERVLLANIAFSRVSHSIQDLSELSELSEADATKLLTRCRFIRISTLNHVEYISETHRAYAAKQLDGLKRKALEQQLHFFEKNPKTDSALRFLPTYLEALNRKEALFDLLSNQHFGDLLESTQSLVELKTQAETALQSALQMERAQEVFKFSLQRSIFASAGFAEGASARVRALVALGRTNAALALANSEATKEDRIALLATFGRRLVERTGTPLDAELLNYIKKLAGEIDFSRLGNRAINIAADVLIFEPDVAIGIIETAMKGAASAARDAAFAELSIAASLSKLKHSTKVEDKARSRISDDSLQQVAQSFSIVAEQLDLSSLNSMLSRMPAGHQIYLLRSLVNIRRKSPRSLDLVELALDTIIREAEYIPRARDLAELCAPFLHDMPDSERLRMLVARIQSQIGLVSKAAHSRDITTLQMRLAAAEMQYDYQAARDRIAETCYAAIEIKTPEAQMESLAVILGLLARLDREGLLEQQNQFRAFTRSELEKVVDHVLQNTADHLETFTPVLKVLAADDCQAAIRLASRMNGQYRRDQAYRLVAKVIVLQPYDDTRLASVLRALKSISCQDFRAETAVETLKNLSTNAVKAPWIMGLSAIREELQRGYQLNHWDGWIMKESRTAGLHCDVATYVERTKEALARAASCSEEAEINFCAAEVLAEFDISQAEKYYREGLRVSATTPFASPSRNRLFELCLSLVSRGLASLARVNTLDDDKLSRYESLVDRLPGLISKVRVLNELAERFWCAKREDLTKRVVTGQLRSLLEQGRAIHQSVGRVAVQIAFPSLCAAHQGLALGLLTELSDVEADGALHAASMLKMRHLCGQEPDANSKFDHTRICAEDVLDLIELISKMRTDGNIYETMRMLVEAVNDKSNRTRFTSTQKADWSARLRTIVNSRLPDPKNIQHQGYVIVCTALVNSLVETPWKSWSDSISEIDKVDNAADRGFIAIKVASTLPSKHLSHRRQLLEKALRETDNIPSPLDRMAHLQIYAESAHTTDPSTTVKDSLREAMRLSIDLEDNSRASEHRRDLIDLADQIDPTLADELIEMVDDDPARSSLKVEAKRHAAMAKAKRELADVRHVKDAGCCDLELLPNAAWKNLGALEAGRLEVKPPEIMIRYVSQAASGTLYDAYPVLSWHLTNMERKYVQPQDVRSHLEPLCEALLLSTELAESILRRLSGNAVDEQAETFDEEEGVLVHRRSRSDAIVFIERWLQEHAMDEIVYCDPYFSTKDVSLLRLFLAHAPTCRVQVIASKPQLIKNGELSEDPFLRVWREQSDQSPPDTEVVALSYVDTPDRNVVHDRWLLSGNSGLRLGTSFSSLGEGKLSEISTIEGARARDVRDQLAKYLSRQRIVDGVRLSYSTFTL